MDANGRHCFAVLGPPQFTNLMFYFVPPSMRDTFNGMEQCTPEQLVALGKVAPKLKDRMQRAGMETPLLDFLSFIYMSVTMRLISG